jgi:hypothetical protein
MAAVAVIAEASSPWRFALLALPAVLLVLALTLSVAAWKRPYAPALGSSRGGGRRPL